MKTLFLTCAAIFVVLLVALVVTRVLFATKKCSDADLIAIISSAIGLLMIVDCLVLLLGGLYISGEKTTFWTSLVCSVLGFLFGAGDRRTSKK